MNIKKIVIVIFASTLLAAAGFLVGIHHSSYAEPTILYSLDKRTNDQAIINVINGAQKYIYFAVYTFTKNNIADALVSAKQRGVDVEGITDSGEAVTAYEQPIIQKLEAAGIPIETQKHADGLMHIKAIVTDKAYAMGSYNWTESATVANDELLEIGTDNNIRVEYTDIIKRILTTNRNGEAENISSASIVGAQSESRKTSGVAGKIYSYIDAEKHIGQSVTIEGTPINVYKSSSGMIFFDYCKSYKTCPFGAVIFSLDTSKFKNILQYKGKMIDIVGVIKSYGGRAEMVINDPRQIMVR